MRWGGPARSAMTASRPGLVVVVVTKVAVVLAGEGMEVIAGADGEDECGVAAEVVAGVDSKTEGAVVVEIVLLAVDLLVVVVLPRAVPEVEVLGVVLPVLVLLLVWALLRAGAATALSVGSEVVRDACS